MTGVIYTREIANNLPYYVIKYDENQNQNFNDIRENGKTMYVARNVGREFLDTDISSLISVVKEIERKNSGVSPFEIEFYINENGTVSIYNMIETKELVDKKLVMSDKEFQDAKSLAKCTYLDEYDILSDMALFGLKRILGDNPRPLDYSLFNEFIANESWSKGVSKLGYQYIKNPMMKKIGNKPYLSVISMLNGLIPANLPEQFKYRINKFYEKELVNDMAKHSISANGVILNTFEFGLHKKMSCFEGELGSDEIDILEKNIKKITMKAITGFDKIYNKDSEAIEELIEVRKAVYANNPLEENNTMKLYKYIEELVEAINEYVGAQFARFGSYDYMARKLLMSLVAENVFTAEEIDDYLNSISTVRTEFLTTLTNRIEGNVTKEDFDKLYGMLRYDSYDIRIDDFAHTDFEEIKRLFAPQKYEAKECFLDADRLSAALKENDFDVEVDLVDTFIKKSIAFKDKIKFEYGKTISLLLDIIARFGDVQGIAKEDMSYLEIQELIGYHSRDAYIQIIEERRNMYHANTYLILPGVIGGVGDIDVIKL